MADAEQDWIAKYRAALAALDASPSGQLRSPPLTLRSIASRFKRISRFMVLSVASNANRAKKNVQSWRNGWRPASAQGPERAAGGPEWDPGKRPAAAESFAARLKPTG